MQLRTLTLFTSDPGSLGLFYRDQLQLPVTFQDGGFTLHCRASTLVFKAARQGNPNYHFAFNIPWNQVDSALEWVRRRVAILPLEEGRLKADFRNWDAEAFYFLDPAGNVVEFIGRRQVGEAATGSFTGASLLSVSEIGIVTDDVALACRQLEELWGVGLFAKQPASPGFAAAGTDEGLFIVVKEGRNWYPTQTPAASAPLTATYLGTDGLLRQLELGG